jgi:hypothetical protein
MGKCRRMTPNCSIKKKWHAAGRCRSDQSMKTEESIARKQAKGGGGGGGGDKEMKQNTKSKKGR